MKKNLLFAILCVLGLFGTLNAQDVVTIDGTVGGYASTTENNKLPVYCANKWAVTQQFYTAEEIGKSSGTIESIAFKTTDKGTYPYTRNLDVYMVNSDEYAIVGNGMKTMSASDLVFSGDVTFAQDSWVTIDITDFEYTGKNVLICVNDKTGANVSGGAYFEGFNCSVTINGSNANRALWKRSTSTAFDVTSINAMSGASQPKIVPFIQFAFTSGTTEEYAEPSKPTNFTYTILNESKVQLSWNAAPETESYNVYEGSDLIANVTETTYTVRNLSLGTHCFTVTGANGPKESEATEELCVNLVAKEVSSVTVGTTGDGDSFTAPMSLINPVNPAKLDSWVEQLYTAAEIGSACTIERISFAIEATGGYSEPFATKEIKIYLAETTKTDYTDENWTPQADLELVFSDTDIIIGDQEWETFELDKPFNYSGTKNLAVVVAKSAEKSSADYLWHVNSVANSVIYTEETATYPTVQGNVTTTRPVVRFSWETEENEEVVLTAPTNVIATPKSTSEIVLTWDVVEGATGYRVYQGETFSNVTDTTFTVEGLDVYTEYCFGVTAERNGGEQETEKVTACAKTSDLAIAAPVVTAEATGTTTIALTWNAVENALSYNVYQGETLLGNVTATTYTVEGLASYTDYSFTVSAVRNEQEMVSAVATAKTLDLVIAAPVVTAEAASATEIVLTWEAVENALSYNVYQGETLLGNVTETTYTVEGLASYTDYSFTVSAVRNEQEMVSAAATAKTLDLAIEMPTNVLAAATGTTTIALTWETVTNALSYNVYYGDTVVNVTSTTYTVEGLDDNTKYCFAVSALRNEQETEKAEACATTTEEIIPVAPTNVVATATSTSEIVLTWSEATNALSYNVYYGDTVVNVTETTYTVSGLELYTDYCFDVTSVREEKETEKVTACARTLDLTIAAPVVTAEVTSATEIVLTWEAVENAMSYVVYQGENSIANVTETTFTVVDLDPETEYCFTVSALRNDQVETSEKACATTLVKKEIIIGDYPTTFFYDFENGNLNGWTVIDKNNDGIKWEFKDGDNGGMNDGKGVYSGTLYGDSADDYLITASKYSMTETSEFSFVFVPYDYTYFQEKIAVVVSEDGETFETVWSYEFEEYSRWQDTTISLKKYAGKDLYVGLHHYDSQDGIRVDNIKLDSKEPAVPANLTAEATPTSITLTWDVVANAASYNVYSVVGEDYTLVENVKKSTYTAEGLDYETEYSYAVTSVNDYKESRYSKVIEVTTLGEPLPEGVEILLKETFEAYTAGDKIAEKGAEHWTTWSKKPGSAEDGIVAELDGNKYGHFTYGNDQVLRLGGYQAGVFELEFDVYVPEGKGGYYNLLHQFEGNTSWAVQAYFQMEEKDGQANPKIADGHGTVHAGSLNTYDVPCVYNDWMHFRIEINANIDEAVYHYTMPGGEEVEAFKWQWSKDCFGDGVVGRKLDAMGFFPPTKGTEFYVDNIILKRIGGESAPIITFNQEEVNGSMAGDDISSVELEIENIGTSIAEYVAWIDYGEGAMSDDYEIISYALEDLSTTTTIGWNPIEEPMTFEIAALYPSSAYAGSVMGTYISAASYFLGEFKTQDGNTVPMLEPGTDMIFRIYGQGINGKPGEVLAEKVLPADSIILDWNVVTFDEPVLLTGFDFYLAVEMTQCVGGSAMVLDGNKDGAYQGYADLCRQTSGTPFRSLTEFTQGEKFGNFHLMVLCMGDAVTGGWAELSKKDGTLEIGAKETIEINFTSIGLEEGKKYDAKIVFNTNTEEGVIELPLSLYVWGENVEEILSNTYNIYPNPTTAQVTVEGENIDYIAVYNSVGLLVKVVRTQNNIVDMSTNENGVYFFNIVDQDGQSSVQRVVVAK